MLIVGRVIHLFFFLSTIMVSFYDDKCNERLMMLDESRET